MDEMKHTLTQSPGVNGIHDLPTPVSELEASKTATAAQVHSEDPTDSEPLVPSEPSSSSLTTFAQRLTDGALHFLSHASNETLGACLVGLGASTYLVLGRVGLIFIGVAGGVVLQATWEGVRSDNGNDTSRNAEKARRREAGIEVALKVLNWRQGKESEKENGKEDLSTSRGIHASQKLDFSDFEPETSAALDRLTSAVIDDYVKYWYAPTVPGEDSFPGLCRRTLVAFVRSVSGHLRRKRPADAFLDFVTNVSSITIVFLNELSAALNASPNSTAADAVATYLDLKPDSNLCHLLDKQNQDRKLKIIAEDILQIYLDPKSYNCPPVQVFLKEILAQLVIGHTITLCSAPEWINEWIVYGLEESETTKEVMDIVGAGVEGRATVEAKQPETSSPLAEEGDDKARGLDASDAATEIHNRDYSRDESAMDEAMREAKRLTQLMIEEDQRRAREELDRQESTNGYETISDIVTTQGVPTPTSSQSDRDRYEAESPALTSPAEADRPSTPRTKQPFTSFDQILPQSQPTALKESFEATRKEQPVLTLHNATISIFDDSNPSERTSIKAKPTIDYLIQIEPPSSAFSGWMIARKYIDFEMLHEVLKRLSVITGVRFTEAHGELPKWKLHTKASLRQELERYLTDAVQYQQLAESEGMKRFLEKDQALLKSPSRGFAWPKPDAFGKLGGDMMNVLTKAPKDVAGGGKALFGGVAGLVGSKKNQSQASITRSSTNTSTETFTPGSSTDGRTSMVLPTTPDDSTSLHSAVRYSQDSLRSYTAPRGERQGSIPDQATLDGQVDSPTAAQRPVSGLDRTLSYASDASQSRFEVPIDPVSGIQDTYDLPPPPSEMPDDYDSLDPSTVGLAPKTVSPTREAQYQLLNSDEISEIPQPQATPAAKPEKRAKPPITEQETSVTIELMFAVITELYTLSSAWQFRRTLLAAAKAFLLRPGNPQLIAIRDLLQKDLLESNLSDTGIAAHVLKIRENALPTAEELEVWKRDYPEKTAEQKEELRVKARKLLVTKGMPTALTSVMGAAASGEALGKVFDCLQIPEVSRGLIFGLMLQALKVLTH